MDTNTQALIQLATETIKACRTIIENLSDKKPEPQLIGLVKASQMVGRSRVWLRRKLERRELTGYQSGRGGCWQVEPSVLISELKGNRKEPVKPVRRVRSQLK